MVGRVELVVTYRKALLVADEAARTRMPNIPTLLSSLRQVEFISGDPTISMRVSVPVAMRGHVIDAAAEYCHVDEYAGLELLSGATLKARV